MALALSYGYKQQSKLTTQLTLQVSTKTTELQDAKSQLGNIQAMAAHPARPLKDAYMVFSEGKLSLKDQGFLGVNLETTAANAAAGAGAGKGIDLSTLSRTSTAYPGLKWIDFSAEAVYADDGDAFDFAAAVRKMGFIQSIETFGGKTTISFYAPIGEKTGTIPSLSSSLEIR